jgi:hypothetical protein
MGPIGLGIYYWGTYIWFVVGFFLIAVPAVIEIARMLRKNGGKGSGMKLRIACVQDAAHSVRETEEPGGHG